MIQQQTQDQQRKGSTKHDYVVPQAPTRSFYKADSEESGYFKHVLECVMTRNTQLIDNCMIR